MTAIPIHRYDKADDGTWCAVAVPGDRRTGAAICCQPETHPVHDVGNTRLENLVRALNAHPWRLRPGDDQDTNRITQHRNHAHHADCALCTGDVHAVAAFAINHLTTAETPTGPPPATPTTYRGWKARIPAMPDELAGFLDYAYPTQETP